MFRSIAFFTHGFHLEKADPFCLKFGVRGPFQQSVPMRVAGITGSVVGKDLKLGTIEWAFLGRLVSWPGNRAIHRTGHVAYSSNI